MPTPALYTSRPSRTSTATPDRHTHPATQTITRLATIDDFDAVNALHERCSLQTRFARYQSARRALRLAEFRHLTHPGRSLTWISHPDSDPDQIIATMNLVRTQNADAAELGIMIEDPWQSRGLGTSLVHYARRRARAFGCSSVVAMTGSTNVRIIKILRGLGAHPSAMIGTTVEVTLSVG